MLKTGHGEERIRVISYGRVTTWNRSNSEQFELLRREASELGQLVVAEHGDMSKARHWRELPQLREVVDSIRAKQCDVVQAINLRRFGSLTQIIWLLDFCKSHGVSIQVPGIGVVDETHFFISAATSTAPTTRCSIRS